MLHAGGASPHHTSSHTAHLSVSELGHGLRSFEPRILKREAENFLDQAPTKLSPPQTPRSTPAPPAHDDAINLNSHSTLPRRACREPSPHRPVYPPVFLSVSCEPQFPQPDAVDHPPGAPAPRNPRRFLAATRICV